MNPELMQAFDFTADDLAYNKAGKLSPRQAAKYNKTMKQGNALLFIVMVGFAIGAFFTLRPFILQGLSMADNVARFIGGIVLVVIGLWILYSLFQKDSPVVTSAQGKAQFVSRETYDTDADGNTNSSTLYYVVLGDEEFSVGRDKYQLFEQGHFYAIYKEAYMGVISVEYIGPPK